MGGFVSLLGLDNWYESNFNKKEKDEMENALMYFNHNYLGCSNKEQERYNQNNDCTISDILSRIVLNTYKIDFNLAIKVLDKTEKEFNPSNENILRLGETISYLVEFFHKNNDKEEFVAKENYYCNLYLHYSSNIVKATMDKFKEAHEYRLPKNDIFKYICMMEKKNKNWKRVIELCNQAKTEGWAGDWDKRIEEANNKLNN